MEPVWNGVEEGARREVAWLALGLTVEKHSNSCKELTECRAREHVREPRRSPLTCRSACKPLAPRCRCPPHPAFPCSCHADFPCLCSFFLCMLFISWVSKTRDATQLLLFVIHSICDSVLNMQHNLTGVSQQSSPWHVVLLMERRVKQETRCYSLWNNTSLKAD